ncbi:MAG: hypothetical protein J6B77_00135 [Clostridia bacterium]|nr:hypothetical protein [Clostridia bacterium]
MGFGILIAGYYLTYLVGMIWKTEIWGPPIILLGCVLCIMGLLKLSEYETQFRVPMLVNALMLVPSIYRVVHYFASESLWDTPIFSSDVLNAVQYVEFLLFSLFGLALLFSIRKLAADVEDQKIVTASVRNAVFVGLYMILQFCSVLPVAVKAYFALAAMLVQLVLHVLMGLLLVSCYMRICDESDKDMPLKKSRFAWVNKMREARAEREQRAADSVTEYAEKKLRARREERERILRERQRQQKNGKRKR